MRGGRAGCDPSDDAAGSRTAAPTFPEPVDRFVQPFPSLSDALALETSTSSPAANWTVAIGAAWAGGFIVVALMRQHGWRHLVLPSLTPACPLPSCWSIPVHGAGQAGWDLAWSASGGRRPVIPAASSSP